MKRLSNWEGGLVEIAVSRCPHKAGGSLILPCMFVLPELSFRTTEAQVPVQNWHSMSIDDMRNFHCGIPDLTHGAFGCLVDGPGAGFEALVSYEG